MSHTQSGFTLVEVLTTIVVALVFLLSAFQLTGTIQQLSITGNQQTVADTLAYSNMRLYANGEAPSEWFDCIDNGSTPDILLDSTSPISNLPAPVLQRIEATAPYGCSDGMPVRVESYVQYGKSNRKISHAIFVSY